MTRGELINKGIAGSITLAFMALVKPDPMPSMVEVALITILMYEVVRWSVWFIRKSRKGRERKMNALAMHYDATRWADEWITPSIREVS